MSRGRFLPGAGLAILLVVTAPWGCGALPAPASAARTPPAPAPRETVRVLFVGNSYTYYNNLPEVFDAVATAAGHPVERAMVGRGGQTLRGHVRDTALASILESGDWDFVVIQEQSRLGMRQVEGRSTLNDPDFFHRHARLLVERVEAAGAEPVFLMSWPRAGEGADAVRGLAHAYGTIARETGARLAPVGLAWADIAAARPDLPLHLPDGSHPAPAGTYLAAATLRATLFDPIPADTAAPDTIRGYPVAVDGTVADTIATLIALDPHVAADLRRAAAAATATVADPGWTPPPWPFPDRTLPALPAGAVPAPAILSGRWEGPFHLFREGRGTLALEIHGPPDALAGRAVIDYGGRLTLDGPLQDPRIEEGELRFEFRDDAMPMLVRFRAVLSDGRLAGVGEYGGEGMFGTAGFRLDRVPTESP